MMIKRQRFSLLKHFIFLITWQLIINICQTQITCAINPNCFQGCSNSNCLYNPSKNSFYNNSITDNTTAYHGPYCCDGCNLGYFLWMDLKTCNTTCNFVAGVLTFGNPLTRTCDFSCPDPYFGDSTTTKCATVCPLNYWADQSQNLCFSVCPSNFSYHFTENNTCLDSCPSEFYKYIGQDDRKMCSSGCPSQFYLDNNTKSCGKQCPSLPVQTYKYLPTKRCQSTCFGAYPYGDTTLNECVSKCSYDSILNKQKFGENKTSTCVYICPNNSYAHNDSKICVTECFGLFSQQNNATNTCQKPIILQVIQDHPILLICLSVGGGIVVISLTILFYNFYLKKRLRRKAWKYDIFNDIQFNM